MSELLGRDKHSSLLISGLGYKRFFWLSDIWSKRHLRERHLCKVEVLATYPDLTEPLGRAHPAYYFSPSPSYSLHANVIRANVASRNCHYTVFLPLTTDWTLRPRPSQSRQPELAEPNLLFSRFLDHRWVKSGPNVSNLRMLVKCAWPWQKHFHNL